MKVRDIALDKQLLKYEVMPDITDQQNIYYVVVQVLERNKQGDIIKCERVKSFINSDEAHREAKRLNGISE